ncbi:MAG: HAD hydrolase family protein [candidate division Zixibacteria bacterium]|nr:HAD hydrolase family protein [candidate division Zixibacteria bacterium]
MDKLKSRLRKIKLFIFDVDGVLTDNTIFIGPDGFEIKRFSIADGLGIYIAKKYGINIALLSGRSSPATLARAKELNITDIFQNPTDKLEYFNQLKLKYQLDDENIAFMGNDLVDLGVMKQSGLAFAVPDSPDSVLQIADYITMKKGGFGAVREALDMVLDAKEIYEKDRLA